MNSKYPKYSVYEELYKRYFKRDVNELIALADVSQADKALDICGGNGRLTKELMKACSDVTYLDQEADMIPEELPNLGVKTYHMTIQQFVDDDKQKYNKVFCQQAINYWLLNIDIEKFSNIVEQNGLFVFNTFANKPTNEPMVKQYKIDDISYLELSYLIGTKVHHIQIREGYEPHYTVFDWIDDETIRGLLDPYFEVEAINDNKTLIYKCRRH